MIKFSNGKAKKNSLQRRRVVVEETAGMWKDRKDRKDMNGAVFVPYVSNAEQKDIEKRYKVPKKTIAETYEIEI